MESIRERSFEPYVSKWAGNNGGNDGTGGGRIFPEHPSPTLHTPRDNVPCKNSNVCLCLPSPILAHLGHSMAIWHYLCQSGPICDYLDLLRLIWVHLWLSGRLCLFGHNWSGSICVYLAPSGAIWAYLMLSVSIWTELGLFVAILLYLCLFAICGYPTLFFKPIWIHLCQSEPICANLGLSGLICAFLDLFQPIYVYLWQSWLICAESGSICGSLPLSKPIWTTCVQERTA